MGAKQRAQKRGKASKGSQKGTPASQKKLNTSMHVPDLNPATRSNALIGWQNFAQDSSPSERKYMSMGDAARNTERHALSWGSVKLRDQSISFVSAGTLHQDPEHTSFQEEEREDHEENQMNGQESTEDEEEDVQEEEEEPGLVHATQFDQSQNIVTAVPYEEAIGERSSQYRPKSVSSSSSEDEQIVFVGRSKAHVSNNGSRTTSKKTSRIYSPARQHFSAAQTDGSSTLGPPAVKATSVSTAAKSELAMVEEKTALSDQRTVGPQVQRGIRGKRGRRQAELAEEEALMQDYIANMAMDDNDEVEDSEQDQQQQQQQQQARTRSRKNETFRFFAGSGEENMKVQVQSAKTTTFARKNLDQAMDWNSDDLEDFDDISTTDDEVVEISQVLRHRERRSGLQYLVTPSGLGTSDAKWVLHENLVSESAQNEIAIFHEIQALEFEEDSLDEDEAEDEDDEETTDEEAEEALEDLIDHIESEDDENARIIKHTAKMTDEQIARALAKQEELGMGSDEIMLFSGDIDQHDRDEAGTDDPWSRNDDFIPFSLKQHSSNRTRSKRNKKNRDSFPSAEAFADILDEDPYGGFDIMDFDRPSLRPKNKGRKSGFPYDLELEDEELREQLVSTWTKDRDKKVQRKREKEEAKQASALEYADRSEPAAIKAEIRRFLVQETDTLRLVPMESSLRASVHRLAKALRLNSHSEGKEGTGKGRYPVLTKTIRTPSYTIDSIWQIDALLNTRKFFPKNAGSYKKDKVPRGTRATMRMGRSGGGGGGSRGGISGASYMNGEIVGASAPELGADNKGRALLEKMGWTSGMAIGAEGNKGSLEAIKHVFKTSRAGLG